MQQRKQFMGWQRQIIGFYAPFSRPDRPFILFLCALSVVMTAANALLIWNLGVAVTQISSGQFSALNQTLIHIAVLILFYQFIKYVYAYNFQRVTLRFIDRVRGSLMDRIMILSFPIFAKFKKGDLLTRLTADIDKLLAFVINVPLTLFSNAIVLLVYASVVAWIDWRMSLVALALSPLFFLSQRFVAPRSGAAATRFTQENAALISLEEQTLGNLRGISTFNSEALSHQKHKAQFDIARAWALKVRNIRILYGSFSVLLLYFAGVVVVYAGVSSIESGRMTIGTLVSFLVYIRNLTMPVRSIARIPLQFHNNRASAERVMEVFQCEPMVTDNPEAPDIQAKHGTIKITDISFTYPAADKPVFKNLSLLINAGETVALVGASGSGKSSLALLLLRFYDPQQGTIEIDGSDIRRVNLASLRRVVTMVWQEPLMLNGTLRENLLLAKHNAQDGELIDACRASHAWEFIQQFKLGLDTLVGTHGVSLSTGQAQRISIAQALLRDAPILILDEATSALDSHAEKTIVETLQEKRGGKTTIIIAHRYSSIRQVEKVIFLDANYGFYIGSHDTLWEENLQYRQAVEWQIKQR